jgi:hypothetical protein
VGIDLAIAKNKLLPICFCQWEGKCLIPLPARSLRLEPPRGNGNLAVLDERLITQFVEEAAAYISAVTRELGGSVERIGIDAPRTPRADQSARRKAEVAMDVAGISCFTTPSGQEFEQIFRKVRRHVAGGGAENRLPHANQLWMYVGFHLFERLSVLAPCIEVFPQATVRAIGVGEIHKSKAGAVESQLSQAAKYTGWPSDSDDEVSFDEIGFGSGHDRLDAYLSAWVAALPESQRVPLGHPPDDVIWVPKLENALFQKPSATINRSIEKRKKRAVRPTVDFQMLCPACERHTFKRWPFGWDAHAAHKCTGLVSSGEADRKAEYRAKYAHLFPGKGK